MHWLFLLIALACLFGAWQLSGWLVPLLLVLALLGFVAWLLGWAASQAARGGGIVGSILNAFIGAVILLALIGLIKRA